MTLHSEKKQHLDRNFLFYYFIKFIEHPEETHRETHSGIHFVVFQSLLRNKPLGLLSSWNIIGFYTFYSFFI